jgi:intracellular septation protein
MPETIAARPINPLLKLALEIGPLAVFFMTFRYGEHLLADPAVFGWAALATGPAALQGESGPVLLATASFMIAIAVSLGVSWWLTRALPRMAVVTAVVVAVFGGLTLWLQDATFIKMKPTIVNAIFAAILGFGLLQGRSYLRYLMGEAMPLTERGWMLFTRNWVAFFVICAVLNEIVWRTQSTEFWVSFKTFFYLPFTFVFLALHWQFLQRHTAGTPGE